MYPQVRIIEVNAHSLSSKYFGESGRLVARMFQQLDAMLEEEYDTFICVLINEVETITSQRQRSIEGNDPSDAMKAVNALLTSLDRIRHRSNVLVLCTSNLVTSLVRSEAIVEVA